MKVIVLIKLTGKKFGIIEKLFTNIIRPLEKLILLNGHQFSSSGINISNWKTMQITFPKKLKYRKKSIFEYGLLVVHSLLFKFKAKIMGCDYSLELIRASKKYFLN